METAQVAKQVVEFQRSAFDSSFNAVAAVQDQTETLVNNWVGQFPWVTEDGRKQMAEVFEMTRKGRDEFRKAVEEGYTRLEKMVTQ